MRDDRARHVCLTDGGANDRCAAVAGRILDDHRGREIAYDGLPVPFLTEQRANRKRQRVVLTDRFAPLVDERQAIDIGIHGDAYVGFVPAHQGAEGLQVFGQGLRGARETAVRLEVDGGDAASQAFEQLGHHDASRPAYRVERDAKPAAPDRLYVDRFERQQVIQVTLERVWVGRHVTHVRVRGASHLAVSSQLGDLRSILDAQVDAVGPDELERVPFDGIVTRGEDDPTGGAGVLDGELHRGGRHESDVDHPASHRHEPGRRRAREQRARSPRVSTEDDFPGLRPGPERRCPTGDDLGSEVGADEPPYPRHPNHEGIGHQTRRASIARTGRRRGCSCGVGMGSFPSSG